MKCEKCGGDTREFRLKVTWSDDMVFIMNINALDRKAAEYVLKREMPKRKEDYQISEVTEEEYWKK